MPARRWWNFYRSSFLFGEKSVTIVAGAGNNGGDGLVVARYLHRMGVAVKVFIAAERDLSPSAKQNYEILSKRR